MDTLSESFKSLKRSFHAEDEETEEESESFFKEVQRKLKLTWKWRLIGFGVCFATACVMALVGAILVRVSVPAFAVLFCIGTIVGVISTFFLVSPIKQAKEMLNVIKVICVVIFVIAFVLTLCAAFWWVAVAELAILFGIIQFAALSVYCVLLIPFAQQFIKSGCGKLISMATS